jgi:hypothetical protein
MFSVERQQAVLHLPSKVCLTFINNDTRVKKIYAAKEKMLSQKETGGLWSGAK